MNIYKTQKTLQLFTVNIKTEGVNKAIKNAKLERLGGMT
jgi:hypothetical protein